MIVTLCSCGRVANVADEHAGRRVRCPACHAVIAIPESDPEPFTLGDGKRKAKPKDRTRLIVWGIVGIPALLLIAVPFAIAIIRGLIESNGPGPGAGMFIFGLSQVALALFGPASLARRGRGSIAKWAMMAAAAVAFGFLANVMYGSAAGRSDSLEFNPYPGYVFGYLTGMAFLAVPGCLLAAALYRPIKARESGEG